MGKIRAVSRLFFISCAVLVILCLPALLGHANSPFGFLREGVASALSVSSGNYACFIAGKQNTTPLKIYFKPNVPTRVALYADDGEFIPMDASQYAITTARAVWLRASFLDTLPLGRYSLVATDATGESATASFYVLSEPTVIFVTQPVDTYVEKGQNATFTVKVTGSRGYKYQWYRRSRTGWKIVKGATSATLTLRKVKGELQGYRFRCKVASAAGDAYSDEARLRILNLPATGDAENPWLYAAGATLSVAALALCLLRFQAARKREKR